MTSIACPNCEQQFQVSDDIIECPNCGSVLQVSSWEPLAIEVIKTVSDDDKQIDGVPAPETKRDKHRILKLPCFVVHSLVSLLIIGISIGGLYWYFDKQQRKSQERIEELEYVVSDFESDIDNLREKVDEIRSAYSSSESSLASLKSDVNSFSDGFTDWSFIVSDVESDVRSLESDLDSVEGAVDSLESELDSLKLKGRIDPVRSLERRIERKLNRR